MRRLFCRTSILIPSHVHNLNGKTFDCQPRKSPIGSTHASFSRCLTTSIMSMMRPPEEVRGMKQLDKEKFSGTFSIPRIELPNSKLGVAMKHLKKSLLRLDNFKPVQLKGDDFKVVYLNPEKVTKWEDIEESDRNALKAMDIDNSSFDTSQIDVTYDNWKYEDIFKAILPMDVETPTSYSTIGHIIHVNLRDQHEEYKSIIGQILLEKIKRCKTVVNKTSIIDTTYRNFTMEVLGGESDFVTCVKENNVRFEFDFSKVYWNPRLSTEHERIVDVLKKGDTLFDVFAGVGPFAIPAARKKCLVYANDLNPESYKWLKHNAKLNKVLREDIFKSYNMDGRDFVREIFGNFLRKEYFNLHETAKVHVTMNLPASAVTFLDSFVRVLKDGDDDDLGVYKSPVIVHVYCFVQGENVEKGAVEMVIENLGHDIKDVILEVVNVRNVAPNKEMMRVSFKMPFEILCERSNADKRKNRTLDEKEPEEKRTKCNM